MSEAATVTKKKQTRARKALNYVLAVEDVAAAETDAEGKPIEGSGGQRVWVEHPLPPGLDEKQMRNRDAIQRACRDAVYKSGQKEYGNKRFIVIAFQDSFEVPFEEVTSTALVAPKG